MKLRRGDFTTITRARSFAVPVADAATFLAAGLALLEAQLPVGGGVRLLGLTLSALGAEAEPVQPVLPL